jgi:hypothetical protein
MYCCQAIAADKVGPFSELHVTNTEIYLVKFEPEGDDGFSSSIVDLFDSLRSPVTFLQDLEWFDEYQEARFFTSLAKVGPMI